MSCRLASLSRSESKRHCGHDTACGLVCRLFSDIRASTEVTSSSEVSEAIETGTDTGGTVMAGRMMASTIQYSMSYIVPLKPEYSHTIRSCVFLLLD